MGTVGVNEFLGYRKGQILTRPKLETSAFGVTKWKGKALFSY